MMTSGASPTNSAAYVRASTGRRRQAACIKRPLSEKDGYESGIEQTVASAYRSGRSTDSLKMKNSERSGSDAGGRRGLGQKEMALTNKNRIIAGTCQHL
jgi:hypothetical protein